METKIPEHRHLVEQQSIELVASVLIGILSLGWMQTNQRKRTMSFH